MILLPENINRALLIAPRESHVCAPVGHMIEHRDIFGDAQRTGCRQHDPKLTDLDALGLHADVKIQQHGIVRLFVALDVEMMLGEPDRFITGSVGKFGLFANLFQHLLIESRFLPSHALFDFSFRTNRRQIEKSKFHISLAAPASRILGDSALISLSCFSRLEVNRL